MMRDTWFEKEDIECIIIGMADIVYENRRLRKELAEALEYKQKYQDLLDRNVVQARDNSAALLNAIVSGVFATPEERAAREKKQ